MIDKCPKCDFTDESENEIRIHALYHHQFLIPRCSTEVAKQNNIDYDAVRDSYAKLQKRIRTNSDLLYYAPRIWEPTISKIRNSVRQCGWNQYQVYEHVKKLPKYMRKDVVRRVKKEIQLRESMDNMNRFIRQEGIVV